ncbi:hypothetical protein [Burkholderia ubonensis]|uniref:hypothetical protein n=1 Tax=Burkholderia ubonensis TaxID=101571 RepID=UPI000ABD8320|nr:hypothetical protein [Burkholderia ubonensis]
MRAVHWQVDGARAAAGRRLPAGDACGVPPVRGRSVRHRAGNVAKPAPAAEPRHWNPAYNTDPIQRACAELPEGWEMQLCMENGAGWIDLYDPAGEKFEADIDADKFDWKIHEAIDIAIEADRAGGKPC